VKLLRLRADGFGALRCEFSFDPTCATIVVDDNERGKSTLMAAIIAGLYGLPDDRRSHRHMTPLERWRPWGGGTYRVTIEIENEGKRYTVQRDFDRGTVEVLDGNGRDITPEFREGKDDFSVGKKLLGLDHDEFTKCAFIGLGELDQVVPSDEKARRATTLRARLENAADTRVGDTNASEALKVLEQAQRRFNSAEVEFTGTVEVAIQRLEAKHGLLESELKTLEHDYAANAGPLEELARLGEDEQKARDELSKLELQRRGAAAAEVRQRLDENRARHAEVDKLRAEADALGAAAKLPANSESEFRATVARFEEAQRNLQGLEARRREEVTRERMTLEAELTKLKAVDALGSSDADHAVALAAEIKRLGEEDSTLHDSVFTLREQLATRGLEPERVHFLKERFGKLDEREQLLLRGQSEVALAFQTEVAQLEQLRTEGSETLREIDAARARGRLPGWIVLTLGVIGGVAGVALVGMNGGGAGVALGIIGVVVVIAGIGMLVSGARLREEDREEALQQLTEAQGRLNRLRTRRAETEIGLSELSKRMGYRDQVEMLREWGEYNRLMEESSPVLRAQDQMASLDSRRQTALTKARELLLRVKGGEPDPQRLEWLASDIRHSLQLKDRLSELDRRWSWIDEEKRVAEATAMGFKERAVRILQSAGLTYDEGRPWPDHARELADRLEGRQRHRTLVDDLIPQATRALLSESDEKALVARLSELDGGAGSAGLDTRTASEVEAEVRRWREALDQVQVRRTDLRVKVEEAQRKYHADHPPRTMEKERIEKALERARRFKQATDLARETIEKVATETHRRWADHLNARIGTMLTSFGTKIEQVRFGDDLDFSVRLWGGQQMPRARADLQLSMGARDQLYLIVRLAIAEFLSRGQSALPLLLDDPFATSDDDRAAAGMKLLIEHFTKDHQLILLTCHRRRYQALTELEPVLYAEKVRWLDFHWAEQPK